MMTNLESAMSAVALSSMSDEDGASLLISMSDDAVRQQVGSTFIAQMQNSPRVRGTFFSNASPAACAVHDDATQDWVGTVASAIVALAVAQTSSHGFGSTVNSGAAQGFLNANLTPSNTTFTGLAMSNYQGLFPTYCQANGTNFGKFLDGTYGDRTHWGSVLADRLSSAAYINQQMDKLNPAVDPSGWYQILFANLYKVACLNASERQRVVNAWDKYLQGRENPGAIAWTVYDHMLASSYNYGTFMGPVQNAVSVSHSHTQTLGCMGGPAPVCATQTTTTYGAELNSWLDHNRGLGGFISGPTNQNVVEDSGGGGGGGGGGCCFVAGTPIMMADGTSKPIEQVGAGDSVVSRDGAVHRRSTQDVIWPIASHELLFGVNDYPPFFNASHPFMTRAGWKSMSPAASKRMNPDLVVTKLEVGDVLLQAMEHQPLRYREVEIKVITRTLAGNAKTTQVHSLHLAQDNPGYHAHGFLVAVNYPQVREEHFMRSFEGITEAERAFLLEHFKPLMPFLRRGLGPYVSEILRRALGGGTETSPIGAPRVSVSHE